MKLKHFQIKNFKSIQDSGICYLPSPDNVTILAGQNESGKSSILQALYAFETGTIAEESIPEDTLPEIHCKFTIDEGELSEVLKEELQLPEALKDYFIKVEEITVVRLFKNSKDSEVKSSDLFGNEFLKVVKLHNDKIDNEKKELELYQELLQKSKKISEEFLNTQNSSTGKKAELDRLEVLLRNAKGQIEDIEKLPSIQSNFKVLTFISEHNTKIKQLAEKKLSFETEIKALKQKLDDEEFDEEKEEDEDTVQADIDALDKEQHRLVTQIAEEKANFPSALSNFKRENEINILISDDGVSILKKNVINVFWNHLPLFIFFDDFCDLLPDQMLISDLVDKKTTVKGYQAVKNMEAILGADFAALDKQHDSKREVHQDNYKDSITADFNERWKQKISDGNGATIHVKYNQGRAENGAYLTFYINTKKGEFLHPAQRSQGFKWFLSFFLHLKAEDKRRGKLIILFDEPGLYLHSKAQNDMLMVFEELAENSQIIYSTHSPYLIDAKKLHRVKLVINSKEQGTTVEKITTAKLKNQPNAIKPIADAIGLDVTSNFSVVSKKNVILEGFSDFHYFTAMKKLLHPKDDFAFIPSMGSSNVHLLMELCIGWGLDWLIIFDKFGVDEDYKKIVRNFFDGKDTDAKERIMILPENGIEDLFAEGDFQLVEPSFNSKGGNSNSMKLFGGKELFARLFLDKVNGGRIKKEQLSVTTINNFNEAFKFIKKGFK